MQSFVIICILSHYFICFLAGASSTENQTGSDTTTATGDSSIAEDNEQFKRKIILPLSNVFDE